MNSGRFEHQFFIGFLICALALVLFIFLPMLNALVLGISLAILFHSVHTKILKMIPHMGVLSAFATVLLAIFVIFAPLVFFGFQIFEEAQGLYMSLISGDNSPFIGLLHGQFQKLTPLVGVDINQYLKQILGLFLDNFTSIFSKLVNVVFTLFLALFTMYYLLKDGEKIKEAVLRISPLSQEHTKEILTKLNAMERSTMRGILVVAVVQGFFVGLGFFIFGLSNPVLWGMVAIFAALVPMLGTSLIIVPGILFLAFTGNTVGTIGFTIWGVLMVGLIDNFLQPKLIGHDTNVHPLLILFSVIGGLMVFGPMGFLLGPLVLSFLLTLLEMYPKIILERNV